jgi:hypothetical protein
MIEQFEFVRLFLFSSCLFHPFIVSFSLYPKILWGLKNFLGPNGLACGPILVHLSDPGAHIRGGGGVGGGGNPP